MPSVKRILKLAEEFGVGPFRHKRARSAQPEFASAGAGEQQDDGKQIVLRFSPEAARLHGSSIGQITAADGSTREIEYTYHGTKGNRFSYGWKDTMTVWTGPESSFKRLRDGAEGSESRYNFIKEHSGPYPDQRIVQFFKVIDPAVLTAVKKFTANILPYNGKHLNIKAPPFVSGTQPRP